MFDEFPGGCDEVRRPRLTLTGTLLVASFASPWKLAHSLFQIPRERLPAVATLRDERLDTRSELALQRGAGR